MPRHEHAVFDMGRHVDALAARRETEISAISPISAAARPIDDQRRHPAARPMLDRERIAQAQRRDRSRTAGTERGTGRGTRRRRATSGKQPLVEIAQRCRRWRPRYSARHRAWRRIFSFAPRHSPLLEAVVGGVHQEGERRLEDVRHLMRVDREREGGIDQRHQRRDAIAGPGQIGIEPAERFDIALPRGRFPRAPRAARSRAPFRRRRSCRRERRPGRNACADAPRAASAARSGPRAAPRSAPAPPPDARARSSANRARPVERVVADPRRGVGGEGVRRRGCGASRARARRRKSSAEKSLGEGNAQRPSISLARVIGKNRPPSARRTNLRRATARPRRARRGRSRARA